MNYLELCQRLVRETGIADTGPTSVVGQVGDLRRVTDWINDAWLSIQSSRPDWLWMWSYGSSTLNAGTYSVSLPNTVESIERVRIGDRDLAKIRYDKFATAYRTVTEGTPTAWTINPLGALLVNAKPSSSETISYEAYSTPTTMTTNIDAPGMPSRYHMVIVYKALRDYALFDVAPELERKAVMSFENMLADLERDQLHQIITPGPVA